MKRCPLTAACGGLLGRVRSDAATTAEVISRAWERRMASVSGCPAQLHNVVLQVDFCAPPGRGSSRAQ
eukprot:8618678-Alexandrium_andersonii.AAC.1